MKTDLVRAGCVFHVPCDVGCNMLSFTALHIAFTEVACISHQGFDRSNRIRQVSKMVKERLDLLFVIGILGDMAFNRLRVQGILSPRPFDLMTSAGQAIMSLSV